MPDTAKPAADAVSTKPAEMRDDPNFINDSNDKDNSQVVIFADASEEAQAEEPEFHTIKLNFINMSNDRNDSDVVIFGKNVASSFGEFAVAWRVIRYCGQGWNHPFDYPMSTTVAVSDSYGNYSPRLSAQEGQAFETVETASGDTLRFAGAASSATEIEVLNNLPLGAVNAVAFKSGKAYATKTSIAPAQKAVFQFKPTIWIGVVSQVTEGQVMNSAIISQVNTELSLLGLSSADIVMTGGGPGPSSKPFAFTLQNVVYA
jgi:hypothetical protein